ncbi:MAG: hypothetical protein V7L04_20440 [Nostoc sp.]|uniref:hypothetical protein n=1 Tax=Nostoc sp. TaxID=1180 RepID=UPI002FFCB866
MAEKTALLNSAYVMECFVRSSYRRQGLKAQNSREFMALNSSERDYYMCGTAYYMAAKKLSNQISNEQLNYLIDDLTEVIPESVSTSPPEIFDEDTRPLKLRIQDPIEIEDIEHIRTDVRTCGLLVDDSSAPGTFKFGHKSFMEYLVATTVKEYIWDDNSEKAKAIRKVIFFPIEAILDLPVSVGFLAEMIGTDTPTKQSSTSNNSRFRGERTIATRLLRVIFSSKSNSLSWFILYFLIFSCSHLLSVKEFKPVKRYFLLLTNPLIILIFSLMTFGHILLLTSGSQNYLKSPINLIVFVIVLSITNTVTSTFFITTQFSNSKYSYQQSILSKLCLWNSICKELQIDDKVLHQIARTSLLPWVKNRPFDYFLKIPK